MFAGLPGIGVGTLFYILAAIWMPVMEVGRLVRGTSSVARWRRIAVQWFYSLGIIASILVADRILMYLLGQASPQSLSPANWLHRDLATHAPQSILAAPIMASLLLLGAVLLVVELWRVTAAAIGRRGPDASTHPAKFPSEFPARPVTD